MRAISTRSRPVSSVSLRSNRSAELSSTSLFHSENARFKRSPVLTPDDDAIVVGGASSRKHVAAALVHTLHGGVSSA